jgi:uncharacterized oxidoreductase
MPRLPATELNEFIVSMFRAAGASIDEARTVGGHLVEASLAGDESHGLRRVPQYIAAMQAGKVKLGAHAQILSETKTMAVVDGCGGFGQVVCREAISIAIEKALESGVAAVTVHNCYHTGRIADYTLRAPARGLIAIVVVNAGGGGQSVAPFGGLARRFGTNPISIAAPSEAGYPIVLDMATSVVAEGKVRDYYTKGKTVPPGWLIDANGQPTTDPRPFCEKAAGALLPVGDAAAGHKGFGLMFMIDILAGALSGAGCSSPKFTEPNDGLLMIVLDIKQFVPLSAYHQNVSTLVNYVKSCPAAPGFREVFIPGEIEFREEKKRREEGIEVHEATWRTITETAAKLGVAPAWTH